MRILNALRRPLKYLVPRAFSKSAVSEKGRDELERLRLRFRARHLNFKQLLSSNNEALEKISRLEELGRGMEPFGQQTLRALSARIIALAWRAIDHLKEVAGKEQDVLLERFKDLKDKADGVLAPARSGRENGEEGGPLILDLAQVTKEHVDQVGSKMACLGEAKNVLAMNVPEGFVLTAEAFEAFMDASDLRGEINSRIQSRSEEIASRMGLAQELQNLIIEAPLPGEMKKRLETACQELRDRLGQSPRLAVRSSALGEDVAGASFAGQHRSLVNVSMDSLARAYKEIVASTYSLEALSYRLAKGIPEQGAVMCVGVLAMVKAEAGGVAYSRDPLGVRPDSMLIHSVFGLPKQVVDGADATDFLAMDRETGQVQERDTGVKKWKTVTLQSEGVIREDLKPEEAAQPSLPPDKARQVFDLVKALERHFGEAQDVEWALDENSELVVLQTRPLPAALPRGPAAHELGPPLTGEESGQELELGRGLTASPGVAAGTVHLLQREADMLTMPKGAVMVLKRPLPRFAPALVRASAVVAEEGGAAGHLASVARELGKPALFGMVEAMERLEQGQEVTVDADSMVVLKGRIASRLERAPLPKYLMRGTPVHNMLLELLPVLCRLNLLDPSADSFRAANCNSMHDIFRYCHEQALLAMFDFGRNNPFPSRAATLLCHGKRSQFRVIDLGNAFHDQQENARGNLVPVEDVHSRPFQAFWRGMTILPWAGPPAVQGRGLASILHESMLNTNLEPGGPSPYAMHNYFMVAEDFLSGQSRFGFHFATVEAMVGERVRENYANFQFSGGAANQERREIRASLVASLLQEQGFETRQTLDCVHARMDNRGAESMEAGLAVLGFITMHTRQLDMVMGSRDIVEHYRLQLREQLDKLAS